MKTETTWLNKRGAGVILHPSSLPSEQGIGCFGKSAFRFIDFLSASGMRYWQVCPLGPTGYGDSPYQCFSAFAGNPYFIDLKELISLGLLEGQALGPLQELSHTNVDYGNLYNRFWKLLNQVYNNYKKNPSALHSYGNFAAFKEEQAHWLHPYACFMACKNHFNGAPWYEWPKGYRSFSEAQKRPLFLFNELADSIEAQKFFQFLFLVQWKKLRAYAHEKGVEIIGDIPIFVSLDSADVWTHSSLFQLGANGLPNKVAGVPPDYFSPLGQLWGNPLYDWKGNTNEVFNWWRKRIQSNLGLYDILRIDHFRGFESYWAVPANDTDARNGKWVTGPGREFFDCMNRELPGIRWIAEDLGDITPTVHELRNSLNFPGMAVLQFAFSNDPANLYLPHNLIRNSVLYSGTHDNDTSWGWYTSAPREIKDQFRRYFRVSGEHVPWDMVRASYESVSNLVIIPLQDLMNKGTEARMNTPGKADGNWQWRYRPEEIEKLIIESSHYLQELKLLYNR